MHGMKNYLKKIKPRINKNKLKTKLIVQHFSLINIFMHQ